MRIRDNRRSSGGVFLCLGLAALISTPSVAQAAVTVQALSTAWDAPTVGGAQTPIPTTTLPAGSANDSIAYDLGTMFQVNVPGNVTKIRYYKPAGDTTVTRVARIWSQKNKTKLREVAIPSETASGWQTYTLPTALAIQPNTPYIVTVNTDGLYPFTSQGLNTPSTLANITTSFSPINGVFGASGQFPESYYNGTNYFRSVVFQPSTPPTAANMIVYENRRKGTSAWKVTNPATGNEILAYSDMPSIAKGATLPIKVSVATPGNVSLDVYRMGYYNGLGGRKIASRAANIPAVNQTGVATTDTAATGKKEYNWSTTINLVTDANWISGLYFAVLTDATTQKQTTLWFVVTDGAQVADIIANIPVTTYQAYNNVGGKGLYDFNSTGGRAFQVSFSRPMAQFNTGITFTPFAFELPMIRWLEKMGYSVTYTTNVDQSFAPNVLLNADSTKKYKLYLSMGHDEYWTQNQYNFVKAARDKGTNMVFLSANTSYWRIRLSKAANGRITENCYKSEYAPHVADPVNPTKRFRDPEVNSPEDKLLGVSYIGDYSNATEGYPLVVEGATHPYFANTGLVKGSSMPGMVGYEWDGDRPNATPPAGRSILFKSPATVPAGTELALDQIQAGKTAPLTENSLGTIYTAPSGAKVFAMGSIQAMWGLDNISDPTTLLSGKPREYAGFKQFVHNMFKAMGAPAGTPSDVNVP